MVKFRIKTLTGAKVTLENKIIATKTSFTILRHKKNSGNEI